MVILMFQSTLPRGERRIGVSLGSRITGFNPRSRAGSDRRSTPTAGSRASFNPRSRAGSDPLAALLPSCPTGFNPRSRAGSDLGDGRPVARGLFQSTLPRGERPGAFVAPTPSCFVSIHAPARGATSSATFPLSLSLFQSTLPRGERPWATSVRSAPTRFNPRSRAGSDSSRGTTTTSSSLFQSTLPRGERPLAGQQDAELRQFQSTLPRGERPLRRSERVVVDDEFQSTLPRGERPRRYCTAASGLVSIHAPARGATFLMLNFTSAL